MEARNRQRLGLAAPWITAAVLFVALSWLATAASGADVNDVLARMRRAMEPGKDMRATVVLTITNERGETVTWTGHLYRRGGASPSIRIVFDDPIDLRGTEVSITRASDGTASTRIYLPALRRVRQIDADVRGESFLGTDFNYEDLGFGDLEYQQHRLDESKDRRAITSNPSRAPAGGTAASSAASTRKTTCRTGPSTTTGTASSGRCARSAA